MAMTQPPSAADAGRERQGVDEGAVMLAVAPLQFQVALAGRGADGPLVTGEGLRGAGGDRDVADEVDAGRAGGEVLAALVDPAVVRRCRAGRPTRFILAARLASASSLVFSVSIRSMATSVGSRSIADGDRADDVRGVDQQRGKEVDAHRGQRPLLDPRGGVAPGRARRRLARLGLQDTSVRWRRVRPARRCAGSSPGCGRWGGPGRTSSAAARRAGPGRAAGGPGCRPRRAGRRCRLSSRAITTARPCRRRPVAAGGRAGHGVGLGGQFAGVVHARDQVGAVLFGGGGDHRLQLVVGLLAATRATSWSPRRSTSLAWASGSAGRVRASICRPGHEAVAVGHVLQQRAEPVDQRLLVLAVAQADTGALDLDGGGDGPAVEVQQDGDLVRAERVRRAS